MNKCLVFLGFCALALLGCTVKGEGYYRSNLKELQRAMNACPQKQPQGLSCQRLEEVALRMHQLAQELQYNPQEFGRKIIALQQGIVSAQLAMGKQEIRPDLQIQLDEKKRDLADHLAVVKWLESPES